MFVCVNWGGTECNPDVSVHKYTKELKDGEKINIWPIGDDLKELDEICKSCELRFFEIDKRECPVCGSSELTERAGIEIQSDGTKSFENAYLKCNTCQSPSVLLKSR